MTDFNQQPLNQAWEARDDLRYHAQMSGQADAVLDSRLVLPTDGRFQLGLRMLEMGTPQGSVRAKGVPGVGKTAFGNAVFGEDRRVDIHATDTEATLFGHVNPLNDGEYVHGRLQRHGQLDPNDPVFYLNELTHLRNARVVNGIWDGELMDVGGVLVPVADAPVYYTTNFADGENVHETDGALDSRTAAEILVGDIDEATARKIQGFETQPNGLPVTTPTLPTAPVRKTIREIVAASYPDTKNVIGDFTVGLLTALNETGLVEPLNPGDARLGQAMRLATRAYMFGGRQPEGTEITPVQAARVAALVLPTTAKLSNEARENIMEATDPDRRLSDMETAIAVRRVIASEAMKTALRQERISIEDSLGTMTDANERQIAQSNVDRFSYANAAVLGYDIDRALQGVQAAPQQVAQPPKRRRFSLGRG